MYQLNAQRESGVAGASRAIGRPARLSVGVEFDQLITGGSGALESTGARCQVIGSPARAPFPQLETDKPMGTRKNQAQAQAQAQDTSTTPSTPVTDSATAIDAQTTPAGDDRASMVAALQAQLAALTGTGSMVVTLDKTPRPVVRTSTSDTTPATPKARGILAQPEPAGPVNVPDHAPKTEASANIEPAKAQLTEAEVKAAQAREQAAVKAAGTFSDRVKLAMATIETFSKVESLATTVAGLKVATGKLSGLLKLAPKVGKANVLKVANDPDYAGVLSLVSEINDCVSRLNDAGRKAAATAMSDAFRTSQLSIQPVYVQDLARETGYVLQPGDTFSLRVASLNNAGGPVFERIVTLPIIGKIANAPASGRSSRATTITPATGQSAPTTSTGRGEAKVPHPTQPGVMLSNTDALRVAAEAGDRRAQECIAKLDAGENANRTFSVSKEAPAAFKRLGWNHPANQ